MPTPLPLFASGLLAGTYYAVILDAIGLAYRNDGAPAEALDTSARSLYAVGIAAASGYAGQWSAAAPSDLPASALDYRVLLFERAGSSPDATADGLPLREGTLSWMGS